MFTKALRLNVNDHRLVHWQLIEVISTIAKIQSSLITGWDWYYKYKTSTYVLISKIQFIMFWRLVIAIYWVLNWVYLSKPALCDDHLINKALLSQLQAKGDVHQTVDVIQQLLISRKLELTRQIDLLCRTQINSLQVYY